LAAALRISSPPLVDELKLCHRGQEQEGPAAEKRQPVERIS
jgi:hypothetical protein